MQTQAKRPRSTPRRAPLTPEHLHPERRLTAREVSELRGDSVSKLYGDIRAGIWPEPERYGKRMSRWPAGVVLELIARRAQTARAA